MGFFSDILDVIPGVSAVAGLFGGGDISSRAAAANDAAYNREVMQNQVQWKVEDAKKAGVHPLYALGAPSVSWSPSTAGGGPSTIQRVADAGQGIARAASAYGDSNMRRKLFEQEVRMNELKIKDAEISLAKNASVGAMNTSGATVPINSSDSHSIPGQGNAIGVSNRIPLPASTKYVSRTGSVEHYPSKEVAEAIEDNMLYQAEHFYRNRIAPFMHDAFQSLYDGGAYIGRATNDYASGRRRRRY